MPKISSPAELEELRKNILSKRNQSKPCIAVCGGTGCLSGGNSLAAAFRKDVQKHRLKTKVEVRESGCPGLCEQGPVVVIYPEQTCYVHVTQDDVAEIVSAAVDKKVVERLLYADPATGEKAVHDYDIPFYKKQMRLTIGDNGKIDPKSIEDYLAVGGYGALAKVVQNMSPEQTIAEVRKAGLRGRSGAGVSAAMKWEASRKAEGEEKYIICNCHEGDPGAYVDRRMMESNPHLILEGMIIGAYAIGATEGYIFVGNEFPLTVENTRTAIKQAEENGLLGKNILGTGMDFTIKVNIDAGDYVCGEMSALMAAIEGRVGEPVIRYDHATERGLWAKPTVVNNLQTWASVPVIINMGADAYAKIGTERSKGTRVFSLTGLVNNCGLVEVPMGMTLREIIFDIGGGIKDGKKFKAVQVGGPMGGFVPESQLNLTVDFDELRRAGLTLGPGLIVADENTCMVDMAKFFLTFLSEESCGKCTPCREGLRQMLFIMGRITEGKARKGDIEALEAISELQIPAALCPLGQGAPNTLLSSIKNFGEEWRAHTEGKTCPAGACKALSAASSRA